VTCEAILKPSGEIVFQYKALNGVGESYTVGIQNGRCDDALLVAYNQSYVHPGLAVRIAPPRLAPWLELPPGAQAVASGTLQHLSLTVNASALSPGKYHADLTIRSNAATGATVVIPVNLTVTP
jgi:hypothetical protein